MKSNYPNISVFFQLGNDNPMFFKKMFNVVFFSLNKSLL